MLQTLGYVGRLLNWLTDYWAPLVKVTVLGAVLGFAMMGVPYASKALIDDVYPSRDVSLMVVLVVGSAVLTASAALMSGIRSYFAQALGAEIAAATSLAFLNHVQHLPRRFFESHQVGEILSRLSDVRGGIAATTSALQTLVSSGVFLILVPPFLLVLNWRLAVLAVLILPVTVTVSTVGARRVRRFAREGAEASASLQAFQVELLTHATNLKAMALEAHAFQRLYDQTHEVLRATLRGGRTQSAVAAINAVVRACGQGLLTWYAWSMILRGEMTLGAYIAFTAYVGYLTGPAQQIALLFSSLQTSGVALHRMFEYLDLPVEQPPEQAYEAPSPIKHRIRGRVVFESVAFRYDEAIPVLRSVSLAFEPGTVTAIVGPSGSGKSTLLRMIPRLVDPTSGRILLDGVPLEQLPLADVRRQVAGVWQEFGLMRGTLWENVALGAGDVSRAAAEHALELCCLDDFVKNLPRGIDTGIGEWGATLSEGQRQRLALARAVARDAAIMLLDEVTANLDPATEERLLDRIIAAYRHRTIVLVTHRPATAARADVVVRLGDGQVDCIERVTGNSASPATLRGELLSVNEHSTRARAPY